jgi:hypothetical protein
MMKMMKPGIVLMIASAIVLSGCSATSSVSGSKRNEVKKEQSADSFEKLTSLVESGNYQFIIRSATPSGGKTIQITSLYAMKAKEGQYEAYLPYYGRAYAGAYGGTGSGVIDFKGEPENLKITRNDNKYKISISFTIKSDRDQYAVNLEMGASGYGNLLISSENRQTISYYGLTSVLQD